MSLGFEGLSDDGIPKIIGAIADGVVKVNDSVKGGKTAPPPIGGDQISRGSFPSAYTPYLIGAGVVIGGFFLWKKLGKRGK